MTQEEVALFQWFTKNFDWKSLMNDAEELSVKFSEGTVYLYRSCCTNLVNFKEPMGASVKSSSLDDFGCIRSSNS